MIISIRGWLSASYGLTSTATITVHHDADRILKSGRKCSSSTSVAYAYFKAYSLSSPVRNGSATTWLTYDWIYVQSVSHRHFFMDLYIYLRPHPLPTYHRICSISFISLSTARVLKVSPRSLRVMAPPPYYMLITHSVSFDITFGVCQHHHNVGSRHLPVVHVRMSSKLKNVLQVLSSQFYNKQGMP
jgi:hypothetical protein